MEDETMTQPEVAETPAEMAEEVVEEAAEEVADAESAE